MAYFDSAKNRAIWARELESLRSKRGTLMEKHPGEAHTAPKGAGLRERVSYEILLAEERGLPRKAAMTKPSQPAAIDRSLLPTFERR